MDNKTHILSLIGLCLRGRNLEVGEEPVEAAARARDARVILLASDAADNTARRVRRFAETGQCVWLRIPFTKQELGQATGRTAAAVAAVTDIGLAVALTRRLAELSPETYDEDLAKLELKAKRAKERKSEAAQHEKNLRRGIKRPKKQESEQLSAQKAQPARRNDTARSAKGASSGANGSHGGKNSALNSANSAQSGRNRAQTAQKADITGKKPFASTRKNASRPSKSNRPRTKAKTDPYAHSRPVKKGKGSFRKKES